MLHLEHYCQCEIKAKLDFSDAPSHASNFFVKLQKITSAFDCMKQINLKKKN